MDQINADGGVDDKQLELEVYDTKLDPATAAQQAQRAISQDNVDALVGPYTTSEALAVADIAENAKVVNFNYSAATPAITEGCRISMTIAEMPPIAIAETSELIVQETLPGPVSPGSPAGPPKIFGWSWRPTCLT